MSFVLYSNCAILLYVMWQMLANNQFVKDMSLNWTKKINILLDQLSTNNLRDVLIIAIVISVLAAVLYRLWHLIFSAISIVCIVLVVSFIYDWYTVGQTTGAILMFLLMVISFINCTLLSSR